MTSDLGIIIVAYKQPDLLRECLIAIERIFASQQPAVAVVDNSRDATIADIVESRGEIYVSPPSNVGYARGVNLGVSALPPRTKTILILNPDVYICRPFDSLFPVDHGTIRSARWEDTDHDRPDPYPVDLALAAIVGSRYWKWERALRDLLSLTRRLQPSGAFLLLSRAYFEELNGFDDRFELYFEDVDICHRAESVEIADLMVGRHIGGSSSSRGRDPGAFIALRVSRLRYSRKYWSRGWRAIVASATLIDVVLRVWRINAPTNGRTMVLRAILKEMVRPGTVWVLR